MTPNFACGVRSKAATLETNYLRDLLEFIENNGYKQIWIPDQRFEGYVYSMLTAVALSTSKVRLGTCVTDPYIRSPALTATAIATVDEFSKGRTVLGIGAGWSGLAELGIERKKPALAVKETIQVVRKLLAGDTVTFSGEIVKMKGVRLDFKTRSNIPIYVAGRGPRIFEVAGELADGVIIGGLTTPAGIEYALKHVRIGAERAKRDPNDLDVVEWASCAISDDGRAAKDLVKQDAVTIVRISEPILKDAGLWELSRRIISEVKSARSEGATESEARSRATKFVTDELLDSLTLAGSPEQIARKVDVLFRSGIKQVAINPKPFPGANIDSVIRRFANEVINPRA